MADEAKPTADERAEGWRLAVIHEKNRARDIAQALADARSQPAAVRQAALAEAARLCADADKSTHPADLAAAIRALSNSALPVPSAALVVVEAKPYWTPFQDAVTRCDEIEKTLRSNGEDWSAFQRDEEVSWLIDELRSAWQKLATPSQAAIPLSPLPEKMSEEFVQLMLDHRQYARTGLTKKVNETDIWNWLRAQNFGLPLSTDVVRLVVAARKVVRNGDTFDEISAITDLDATLEPFASRVPWDEEPESKE